MHIWNKEQTDEIKIFLGKCVAETDGVTRITTRYQKIKSATDKPIDPN
jgi:hypothetical protein